MRRFRTPLIGLALTLLLGASILMLGCGSADDGTPNTYTDSEYGFSFEYPSDWEVLPSTDANTSEGAAPTATVTVADPDGAVIDDIGVDVVSVRVYELGVVIDDAALPQILPQLEEVVQSLQAQDTSLQIEEPLTETTVGTLNGYEFTATFDWPDGTPMKTTSYFLFDGDIEYQLVLQAVAADWDSDQEAFDLFISTFQP